jgi:hypothetical protein
MGEWRYSYMNFQPQQWFEINRQLYLPMEKGPLPTGKEAGWTPELVWTEQKRRKSLPHLGMKPESSSHQPISPNMYFNNILPAVSKLTQSIFSFLS